MSFIIFFVAFLSYAWVRVAKLILTADSGSDEALYVLALFVISLMIVLGIEIITVIYKFS